MFGTKRLLLAGICGVAVLGAVEATGSAAPLSPADNVRVLKYDAGQASKYSSQIEKAVTVWNESVDVIRLEAGTPADITIRTDSGWPQANPSALGSGSFTMGQQAIDEGYDPTRIAAHEMGYILGLDDNRTGRCEDLMSGHSAGTSCKSPQPSTAEANEVRGKFSRTSAPGPRRLDLPILEPTR